MYSGEMLIFFFFYKNIFCIYSADQSLFSLPFNVFVVKQLQNASVVGEWPNLPK